MKFSQFCMRTLIYPLGSYFYKKMKIMAWVDLGVFQGHTQAPNLRKKKIVSKNKYSSQVYRPSDSPPLSELSASTSDSLSSHY